MKETIVKQIIWSSYEELADVPSSWLIFNAPRPIYGTPRWDGPFLKGRFWAVLDPEEYNHDGFLRENLLLQAAIVRYVNLEQVTAWVEAWCQKEYGNSFEVATGFSPKIYDIWDCFTRENKVTQEFTIDR